MRSNIFFALVLSVAVVGGCTSSSGANDDVFVDADASTRDAIGDAAPSEADTTTVDDAFDATTPDDVVTPADASIDGPLDAPFIDVADITDITDVTDVTDAGTANIAAAKIFGYLSADGNYFTDAPPPTDGRYNTNRPEIVNDLVHLACASGHRVTVDTVTVDCARYVDVVGSGSEGQIAGGSVVVIRAFQWPHATHLDMFTLPELRAFFSGLLIGEGSRAGLIDDQSPNIPAGHYTMPGEIDAKMSELVRALMRLGFSTAHKTTSSGGTCSTAADNCRQTVVDRADFCRFNAREGFTFVLFKRVPGAIALDSPASTDPRRYSEPPPCP